MRKSITAGLVLLWICMMILGGCSSKTKIFSLEDPQKVTVTSISGEKIEVTDGDMIETISVMSEDTILYNNYFWIAVNGSIDTEIINAVISTMLEVD